MNCKIGLVEWIILIILTIMLDVVQVILDLFIIGIVLNRIIDLIVGFCLPLYFWFRGVSMKSGKNWAAFLGAFGLEEIGLGGDDGLPLWTAEVGVVWLTVTADKIIQRIKLKHPLFAKVMDINKTLNTPLNKDGVRLPQTRTAPLNQSGMRLPTTPSLPVLSPTPGGISPKI
jgi:hypothetical protein